MSNTGFSEVDIKEVPFIEIFNFYKDVEIVVKDNWYNEYRTIKLNDYYNELRFSELDIDEWLLIKTNEDLITYKELPVNDYISVQSHDIEYVGYQYEKGDMNKSLSMQEDLTIFDCNDLRISHKTKEMDYSKLNKISLFTMNGCFVRTYGTDNGVYILNGGKHYRKYQDQTHINMWMFDKVSTFKIYSLNDSNLEFKDILERLRVNITLDTKVVDKTVWLVLNGHLILNDVLNRISDNSFSFEHALISLKEKFNLNREILDLDHLIDKDEIYLSNKLFNSKDFLTKLLTDETSFVIVFDNTDMNYETIPIDERQYPSCFVTSVTDKLPLRLSNGLFASYVERPINKDRLLEIDIRTKNRYLIDKTGIDNGCDFYFDTQERYRPLVLSKGQLIKISTMFYNKDIKEDDVD